MGKRCSIACIVPPVLLEELARKGTDDERDAALRTLSLDATLRLARTHNALVGAPVNRTTVRQSLTAGQPQRTIYDCHEQEPVTNPQWSGAKAAQRRTTLRQRGLRRVGRHLPLLLGPVQARLDRRPRHAAARMGALQPRL
jgi:hypothetical protein